MQYIVLLRWPAEDYNVAQVREALQLQRAGPRWQRVQFGREAAQNLQIVLRAPRALHQQYGDLRLRKWNVDQNCISVVRAD